MDKTRFSRVFFRGCLSVLLLVAALLAPRSSSGEDATAWPETMYGVHVGTGIDKKNETGLAWGLETNGHAGLIERVDQQIEQAGRAPDFLLLHFPGAFIEWRIEMIGLHVLREGGYGLSPHPVAVETLPLWNDFLLRHKIPGVLYLGSLFQPATEALWKEDQTNCELVIGETLQLAKASGFRWVACDEIVRQDRPLHDPIRKYFLNAARSRGIGIVVEAWPHKSQESLFGSSPAWMTHSAFLTQHPAVSPHRWGQANHESRRGLVVYDAWASRKEPFSPELANRIVEAHCWPAIDFDQWGEIAGSFPEKKSPIELTIE